MRELADAVRVRAFMRALGAAARSEATCYLTGGATAVLVGWRAATVDVDIALEPSPFVAREGKLDFRHFDPRTQALAKLERAHDRDLDDVRALIEAGLVDRRELRAAYAAIEPSLYRFPAIDPRAFRRRVEEAAAA